MKRVGAFFFFSIVKTDGYNIEACNRKIIACLFSMDLNDSKARKNSKNNNNDKRRRKHHFEFFSLALTKSIAFVSRMIQTLIYSDGSLTTAY